MQLVKLKGWKKVCNSSQGFTTRICYLCFCLEHRLYIKMNDPSPLYHTVQIWNQDILHRNAAIFHFCSQKPSLRNFIRCVFFLVWSTLFTNMEEAGFITCCAATSGWSRGFGYAFRDLSFSSSLYTVSDLPSKKITPHHKLKVKNMINLEN